MTITIEEEANLTIENIKRYTKELQEILRRQTPIELPKNENNSSNVPDQKTIEEMREEMVKQIKKNIEADYSGRPRISFRQVLKKSDQAQQEEGLQDNKGSS